MTYQFSSHSQKTPKDITYLVRRANSLGELNNQPIRKTEIFAAKTSPSPQLSRSSKAAGNSNTQTPQFYTDRNFSKTFLSDSVPLSQMIVGKANGNAIL